MRLKPLLLLLSLLTVLPVKAQLTIGGTPPVYDQITKTYMLTVPEDVFGGPYLAPVIIDNNVTEVKINGKAVTTVAEFPLINGDTSYTFTFKKNGVFNSSSIHFTYLPIMSITGTFSNDYVEALVQFIFPGGQQVLRYKTRIKQAGASTNSVWVHKHNYHVKFVDDNGEKMDVSFFGFRNDNHWRLDAGTRDMIRFRNYAANGLWADFGTKSYYADKQPGARSYIRGSHVEVFMNGSYHGFYNFTEFLDRKQLKLKKYAEREVVADDGSTHLEVDMHGMLWKAIDDTPQALFSLPSDTVDNTSGEWAGFELKYPDIDEVCPTDYSVLQNAVRFVARSNQSTFNSEAAEYFDLPVMVDYYLFITVVFGIDNACNNMVFACYDSAIDKKLTLAVWDLDATVGQHYADMDGYYHADVIQPENELEDVPNNMCALKRNKLFTRVKAMPGFMEAVKARYWQLRPTILCADSLVARYTAIYNRLDACGALDREAVRWSDTGDISHRMLEFPEEFDYLCDWLRRRIAYLDTHTFACQPGDINGDSVINIADVTLLIGCVLGDHEVLNTGVADVNGDGFINVADVTALISLVLNT